MDQNKLFTNLTGDRMDNIKLLRMDNFEDDLCGVVSKLTDKREIEEYGGKYVVDLMSGGENLISEYFFNYESAVNQVINFVSCTAWKKDKTVLAWDILRDKIVA